MARPWIRLDTDILNDDRFEDLNAEQLAAWVKAYLLIAEQGDAVRDQYRLARLLSKEGILNAAIRVDELDRAGWFVPSSRHEGWITLRGFEERQPLYRGPSDDPSEAAARMRRYRERNKRSSAFESVRNSTGQDGTKSPSRTDAQERARDDDAKGASSLRAGLERHGYRP